MKNLIIDIGKKSKKVLKYQINTKKKNKIIVLGFYQKYLNYMLGKNG